jgi:hypothetical protein
METSIGRNENRSGFAGAGWVGGAEIIISHVDVIGRTGQYLRLLRAERRKPQARGDALWGWIEQAKGE